MKSSFIRRALLLLPLACAALYGCPQQEETQGGEEYADVILEGDVTDEAMIALGSALDQQAPKDDPARSPNLDSPAGTELPKSPIAVFQWHFGEKAAASPAQLEASDRSFALAPAVAASPWPRALTELFGPPRAAQAHGDPTNGIVTLLTFSAKSDARLARVLTNQTSYTPSQQVWDKLVAAQTEITLSLVAAEFDNDRIADGGDPVQGTKLVFTIKP